LTLCGLAGLPRLPAVQDAVAGELSGVYQACLSLNKLQALPPHALPIVLLRTPVRL
jgi:hypothetical protein